METSQIICQECKTRVRVLSKTPLILEGPLLSRTTKEMISKHLNQGAMLRPVLCQFCIDKGEY